MFIKDGDERVAEDAILFRSAFGFAVVVQVRLAFPIWYWDVDVAETGSIIAYPTV
jgi:hypothetical protein